MAQRDYAARSSMKKKKKQNKNNKSLLLMIAAMVVVAFGLGLYLLKEKAPEPVAESASTVETSLNPMDPHLKSTALLLLDRLDLVQTPSRPDVGLHEKDVATITANDIALLFC